MPPSLVNRELAAECLGVAPETIRTWQKRNKITPKSYDSAGKALYEWKELVVVERATRLAQGRKRTAA